MCGSSPPFPYTPVCGETFGFVFLLVLFSELKINLCDAKRLASRERYISKLLEKMGLEAWRCRLYVSY
jgi:hypothetical protein